MPISELAVYESEVGETNRDGERVAAVLCEVEIGRVVLARFLPASLLACRFAEAVVGTGVLGVEFHCPIEGFDSLVGLALFF